MALTFSHTYRYLLTGLLMTAGLWPGYSRHYDCNNTTVPTLTACMLRGQHLLRVLRSIFQYTARALILRHGQPPRQPPVWPGCDFGQPYALFLH